MPSGLPYVARGVIWIHFTIQGNFPSHLQARPSLGGQYHKCIHPLMGLPQTDQSQVVLSVSPLIFCWDRFIMGYHCFYLLRLAVKLDGITTIFAAAIVGLLVGPLSGVLFGVFIK